MTKRVLVIGKTSQLGQALQKWVKRSYNKPDSCHCERSEAISQTVYDFTFVGRETLDFAHPHSIPSFFADKRFDFIINCAAYTAVDNAESEPELADQINHLAVKQLAETAKTNDSVLIHISTDYVFDGQQHRPYIETDPVAPLGIYGATKLKAEQACLSVNAKGVIIRTSWLYSEFGNNFVKTMLRRGAEGNSLNVVCDQFGSPTYASNLAKAIMAAIAGRQCVVANKVKTVSDMSIYHYCDEGVCSWYNFATTIFEIGGVNCHVNPVTTKDYPTAARRPNDSSMSNAKIKADFSLNIPSWREALSVCLNELKKK
ncbi:dTDP-4-dehydrorhamnose reductase [Thiomicrospira sp. ALE5]|uniref:dTDP-4-dehydrorhamnose reductase n=1 Tax=Thiomicrospira sp. ALE5 TaxID=748650 RepID=UPI000AD56B91|nr:dTDP-4-dehydrorhamnose reductase [Thiomicrospira sp. ALE5]